MIKKLLATTAVVALTAAPALAGSLVDPVVEPAPTVAVYAPEIDWSGFYVGANAAAGVTGGTTYYGAGVHAGYLQDMGSFVVGGEVSYTYVISPTTDHFFTADAILGYDAGSVMPHVTLGGSYLAGPGLYGLSAGAGLSVLATDNVMITGRYRYTYEPTGPNYLHQGTVAVSYRF